MAAVPSQGTPRPFEPVEWYGADPTRMERYDEPTKQRGRTTYRKPGKKVVTPELKEKWLKMKEKGMTAMQIAQEEGVSKHVVNQAIAKGGQSVLMSVGLGSSLLEAVDAGRGTRSRGRFVRELIDKGMKDLGWYDKAASLTPFREKVQRWVRMRGEGWSVSQIEEAEGVPEAVIREHLKNDPKIQEMARREMAEKAKAPVKQQNRISLRILQSLRDKVKKAAESLGIGINQFIQQLVGYELQPGMQSAAAIDLRKVRAYHRVRNLCSRRFDDVAARGHRASA